MNRFQLGACPRCKGDVQTRQGGDPTCLQCGWVGVATPEAIPARRGAA